MVKPSALLYIAGPYIHDYYNPCQRTCNTTGVYGVWRKENIMNKDIITKNEIQMKYLYGEETVSILKSAIKQSIKNGDCVTMSIEELDKLSYKHIIIAKIKLLFKRLLKRLFK